MPLQILIVDDNRDNADSLAYLFELWGHRSFVAYDGASGLEAACEKRPDCLILDINMPKIDGYTLARLVRERGLTEAKLVALSAYSDISHVRRVEEAGFDYRLTKPAAPDELKGILTMIESILRIAEKTEELAKKNVAVAERTEELAQKNAALAGQTKELLEEVKTELKEVKAEVQEIREDIREVKENAEKDNPPAKS